MERTASPTVLCGTYDARHIESILRFLRVKAEDLDAAGREKLLAHASRLPGLGGCFVEREGVLVFRPVA